MNIKYFFKINPLHIENDTYFFLKKQEAKSFSNQRDVIDVIKDKAKNKLGFAYNIFVYIFSPVMPRIKWSEKKLYINYLIEQFTNKKNSISLQVGSGASKKNNNVINLDIFNFPGTDVVADATKLPFRNCTFDNYISIAVLEHVNQPEAMISEASRVLKDGGIIITGAPFLQGFHASPHDYSRWTNVGLESIHSKFGFEKIGIFPIAGPASALTWILIDFFSIIFSLGLNPLYYFWFIVFSILLVPLKLIDIFLILHPEAYKISSFFVYVGKKSTSY